MLSSDKSNIFVSMKVQLASVYEKILSSSKVNLSKILILKSIVCCVCVMFSSDVSWGMNDEKDEINRQNMIKNALYSMSKGFRVVLLGDEQVGKTQILNKKNKKKFCDEYISTIGCEIGKYKFTTEEKENSLEFELTIFDAPGQEIYRSVINSYLKNAHAVVFVYDITNEESFENIHKVWRFLLQDITQKDALCFLVGNKADMESERNVRTEEAEKYAEENNMQFFEVSAKTGDKIEELFEAIANACAGKAIKDVVDSVNNKINNKNSTLKDSKEPEKNDIKISTSSKNNHCNCCPCCNKDEEDKKKETKSPKTQFNLLTDDIN